MSRGNILEIREPAAGVAMAQCFLYRNGLFPSFHRYECSFCDVTMSELRAMLEDFNDWAGLNGGPIPDEIELFLMLPSDTQAEQVSRAKGVVNLD